MWSCAGSALVVVAVAASGCASDADAVITVRRQASDEVMVQLCSDDGVICQAQVEDPLFTDTEPPSVSKIVEVYLDMPADALSVRFTIGTCMTSLHIPFDGDPRTPSVGLPDALTGCDDCSLESCP